MKITSIFLLLMLAAAAGCSSKKDNVAPTPTAADFPQLLTSGIWVVTSYTEASQDKTSTLSGYQFTFDKSGQSAAKHGADNTPGSWLWGGNSYYGTPADSKTLTLTYSTQQHPLDRIGKGWIIKDASSTVITLDSSNPAEQTHLVFGR